MFSSWGMVNQVLDLTEGVVATGSVTRLGFLMEGIGNIFSYKSCPNIWLLFGLIRNVTFEAEIDVDYFGQRLVWLGYLLFRHLVTLVIDRIDILRVLWCCFCSQGKRFPIISTKYWDVRDSLLQIRHWQTNPLLVTSLKCCFQALTPSPILPSGYYGSLNAHGHSFFQPTGGLHHTVSIL